MIVSRHSNPKKSPKRREGIRTHSINPIQPRIPHKQRISPINRIVETNRILLRITMIDVAITISLISIRNTLLSSVHHRGLSKGFRKRSIGSESSSRYGIKISLPHTAEIQILAIGRKSDTISAKTLETQWLAGLECIDWSSPDVSEELLGGGYVFGALEVTPGFAGAEFDDDETGAAFDG